VPEIVLLLDMPDKPEFLAIQLNLVRPTDKTLLLVDLVLVELGRPQLIKIIHDHSSDNRHEKENDDVEIEVVPEHSEAVDLLLRDTALVDVLLD
jgi:diaminopimelate decarboxylase